MKTIVTAILMLLVVGQAQASLIKHADMQPGQFGGGNRYPAVFDLLTWQNGPQDPAHFGLQTASNSWLESFLKRLPPQVGLGQRTEPQPADAVAKPVAVTEPSVFELMALGFVVLLGLRVRISRQNQDQAAA